MFSFQDYVLGTDLDSCASQLQVTGLQSYLRSHEEGSTKSSNSRESPTATQHGPVKRNDVSIALTGSITPTKHSPRPVSASKRKNTTGSPRTHKEQTFEIEVVGSNSSICGEKMWLPSTSRQELNGTESSESLSSSKVKHNGGGLQNSHIKHNDNTAAFKKHCSSAGQRRGELSSTPRESICGKEATGNKNSSIGKPTLHLVNIPTEGTREKETISNDSLSKGKERMQLLSTSRLQGLKTEEITKQNLSEQKHTIKQRPKQNQTVKCLEKNIHEHEISKHSSNVAECLKQISTARHLEQKPAENPVEIMCSMSASIEQRSTAEQHLKQSPTAEQHLKQSPRAEQHMKQRPTAEQHLKQSPTAEQHLKQSPTAEQHLKQSPTAEQHLKHTSAVEECSNQNCTIEQSLEHHLAASYTVEQSTRSTKTVTCSKDDQASVRRNKGYVNSNSALQDGNVTNIHSQSSRRECTEKEYIKPDTQSHSCDRPVDTCVQLPCEMQRPLVVGKCLEDRDTTDVHTKGVDDLHHTVRSLQRPAYSTHLDSNSSRFSVGCCTNATPQVVLPSNGTSLQQFSSSRSTLTSLPEKTRERTTMPGTSVDACQSGKGSTENNRGHLNDIADDVQHHKESFSVHGVSSGKHVGEVLENKVTDGMCSDRVTKAKQYSLKWSKGRSLNTANHEPDNTSAMDKHPLHKDQINNEVHQSWKMSSSNRYKDLKQETSVSGRLFDDNATEKLLSRSRHFKDEICVEHQSQNDGPPTTVEQKGNKRKITETNSMVRQTSSTTTTFYAVKKLVANENVESCKRKNATEPGFWCGHLCSLKSQTSVKTGSQKNKSIDCSLTSVHANQRAQKTEDHLEECLEGTNTTDSSRIRNVREPQYCPDHDGNKGKGLSLNRRAEPGHVMSLHEVPRYRDFRNDTNSATLDNTGDSSDPSSDDNHPLAGNPKCLKSLPGLLLRQGPSVLYVPNIDLMYDKWKRKKCKKNRKKRRRRKRKKSSRTNTGSSSSSGTGNSTSEDDSKPSKLLARTKRVRHQIRKKRRYLRKLSIKKVRFSHSESDTQNEGMDSKRFGSTLNLSAATSDSSSKYPHISYNDQLSPGRDANGSRLMSLGKGRKSSGILSLQSPKCEQTSTLFSTKTMIFFERTNNRRRLSNLPITNSTPKLNQTTFIASNGGTKEEMSWHLWREDLLKEPFKPSLVQGQVPGRCQIRKHKGAALTKLLPKLLDDRTLRLKTINQIPDMSSSDMFPAFRIRNRPSWPRLMEKPSVKETFLPSGHLVSLAGATSMPDSSKHNLKTERNQPRVHSALRNRPSTSGMTRHRKKKKRKSLLWKKRK
ncbi:uncharacterized protein LOC121367473 isoform X2 [Gigantopelta aegis]|uniref:uncharacterized protein LOC121367473 isoform X2 n=1 Tax=Gigantopelta aegis TaxID=1735272 RepID=UPI001B88BE0F|nr:uncharacterized protein LOC121367473 isoform X2 [Gigantopelta aegis]